MSFFCVKRNKPGFRKIIYWMLTAHLIVLSSCNKTPLFDELYEDRMLLFMKGTYSTNGPKDFNAYLADTASNPDAIDDSITIVDSSGNADLTLEPLDSIRFDFAQIGVINSSKGDFDIDEDNVQKLSDYRQLFFFKFNNNPNFIAGELYNSYDLADPALTEEDKRRKINDSTLKNSQFFNDVGYGVSLKGDDVKPGEYNKFRMFVRRIITSNSKSFQKIGDGADYSVSFLGATTSTYDNNQVTGSEISKYYRYPGGEIGSPTVNYLFPYTFTKSFILTSEGPLHIEFRFAAKNNMKVFESSAYSGLVGNVFERFWSFSDISNNFKSDTQTMLGNFMIVLHIYNPETAGTITGSISSNYLTGGDLNSDTYVAVVQSGSAAPTNYIPDMGTGTAANGIYTVTNVLPGAYDVYLMRDINSVGDNQENKRDGFPETSVFGPVTVNVPEKGTATANLQ